MAPNSPTQTTYPLLQGCCSRACYEKIAQYIGEQDLRAYADNVKKFADDAIFLPFVHKHRLFIADKILRGYNHAMMEVTDALDN
jgi:hypothetical protein